MKKFTLGVISGISGLALAVPIVAQIGFAQSESVSSMGSPRDRPVPDQTCLLAMVDLHDAQLANFDTQSQTHKQMMQEKRDALAEIAAIADDTARQEAMTALHEEMRANKGERPEPPAAITTAMEAVKAACGDMFGMHGFGKFGGHHKGGFMKGMHGKMMPPGEDLPLE